MNIHLRPSIISPTRRSRAGRPGFTLVEVLVAVGVVLVAFLGVITVYLVGYGDITEGGLDTAGAVAAQSLVERIRNQPFANMPLLNGMDTSNTGACPGVTGSPINTLCLNWAAQVAQLPQGQGTVTVVPVVGPSGVTQQIRINVSWVEAARGGRRQLTVVAGRTS